MTNSQNIIGSIRIERRIYDHKKDSLYYAYLYCRQNDYIGNINNAIIDAFQLIHTPLGLNKYGSQEEATRLAMQSISILQGHINYLTEALGLSYHGNSHSPPPTMIKPQNLKVQDFEDTTEELSESEKMALNLFDSFSLD